MKIGLMIAFAGRNCGGPEVYERELVRALVATAPQHEYHLYCLDRRARRLIDLESEGVTYHPLSPSVRAISMITSLPLALRGTKPRVFHAPVITPPFCPRNTIMHYPCSSLILYPEFFPLPIRMRLRFLLDRAVLKAEKIICPSEHVRDVVIERFGVSSDRTPVICPGVHQRFRPIPEPELQVVLRQKYGIDRPYFLFSGRWEARKNVVRTLEAFAKFKRETPSEHVLVFSGGRSWGFEQAMAVIKKLGLENSLVDVGKSPIDELPYLYAGADALVYASLCEGFGMPIIEAMACGTTVITSNITAMPETAGGAAILVNPYSIDDLAGAMHRVATDSHLRDALRAKGMARVRSFGWIDVALKTLDLYTEVAATKRSSAT